MRSKCFMIILLFVILTAGCSPAGWQDAAVDKDNGIIVRLQQKVKEGRAVPQHYRHPADISAQTLAWFFNDLTYKTPPRLLGSAEEKPIFQETEIRGLAPAISRMLQKADSAQRIQFTSFNYGGGLVFQKRRITQGTLFVDAEGDLNVDFSWINTEVDLEDQPKRQGQEYAKGDPAGFEKALTPVMTAQPYIRYHQGRDGQSKPMWIEAGLEELHRRAQSPRTDTQADTAKPAVEPGEAEKPAPAMPAADWESKKERVRSRLEYLKNLYEEGLISESEYQAQKQQVLKELQ